MFGYQAQPLKAHALVFAMAQSMSMLATPWQESVDQQSIPKAKARAIHAHHWIQLRHRLRA
jgi:hypothetical protein